jgi:hypothetical protein
MINYRIKDFFHLLLSKFIKGLYILFLGIIITAPLIIVCVVAINLEQTLFNLIVVLICFLLSVVWLSAGVFSL